LPTKTDSVPNLLKRSHGCISDHKISFNCYMFEKDRKITKANDWAFDRDTFLYGYQIEDYELSILNSIYQKENKDYIIIGTLIDDEYKELIKCFSKNANVKYKHRKHLETILH